MSKGYLETKRYTIRTISPIHIQGNDASKDYGQSFVRWPKDPDFIYIVDLTKLQNYLYKHHGGLDALYKFADWIEKNAKATGIITFLKEDINFNFNNVPLISKGKVYAGSGKKFIRNAMNKAYIPGSSIKGAIKTAVLWKIMQNMYEKNKDKFKNNLIAFIDKQTEKFNKSREKNKFKETFFEDVVKDIFQNHLLRSKKITPKQADNLREYINKPFSDFFRSIKVKDSNEIPSQFIKKKSWNILSIKSNIPYLKLPKPQTDKDFFFDAYNSSSINFEISLDNEILENFDKTTKKSSLGEFQIPFDSLDKLMNIVFEFSDSIWNELKSFYNPYYIKNPQTTLQVGDHAIGIIDEYKDKRGFGFIKSESGQKLFFHISNVKEESKGDLKEGSKVRFKVIRGKKENDLAASNVEIDNAIKLSQSNNQLNINNLIDFYKNQKTSQMMKLGWGTGLLGTTIAILLKNDSELKKILIHIRDDVISYDKKKHDKLVPKSTRVVCNDKGEPEFPLGWISLEER